MERSILEIDGEAEAAADDEGMANIAAGLARYLGDAEREGRSG